jgi:hypothetical protein
MRPSGSDLHTTITKDFTKDFTMPSTKPVPYTASAHRSIPHYNHLVTVSDTALGLGSNTHAVNASYFTEDGSYTLFKGSDHGVVAAFKTDVIVSIRRGDPIDDNRV